MTTAGETTFRTDLKVVGLVSAGHFMSHFFVLTLPPLFFLFQRDLGVSFTALGVLLAVRSFITGALQVPAGFMVDRIGAKASLAFGLTTMAVSVGLMAFVESYWMLMLLVITLGIGSSPFHPADYTILNSSVRGGWIGKAFSTHTFSGHLGSAAAPAAVGLLIALWNWRIALALIGIFGLIVMLVLLNQWSSLKDDVLPKKNKEREAAGETVPSLAETLRVMLTGPMLILILFFSMTALTTSGMHSFFVAGLVDLHDTSVVTASNALSFYLFASAAGVLLGGVIADMTRRHDIVAVAAFLFSGSIILSVALYNMPALILLTVMAASGLMQGAVRPARDMMVRDIAPRGAMGKAFGFAHSGAAFGGAAAPIVFGMLLDAGRPEWVFYALAVCFALSILAAMTSKKPQEKRA